MTSTEIANQFGYHYAHDCSLCSGKYRVFLNPDFPGVEVKIKKSGGQVNIYRGGQRIAMASQQTLEMRLRENKLVKTTEP